MGKGREGVRGRKEKGREGRGRKEAGRGYSPYQSSFVSGAAVDLCHKMIVLCRFVHTMLSNILLFANFSVCVVFDVLCLYIISKPAEKNAIEVGCKLEVIDRGVVYIAKVKFFF